LSRKELNLFIAIEFKDLRSLLRENGDGLCRILAVLVLGQIMGSKDDIKALDHYRDYGEKNRPIASQLLDLATDF